MSEAEITEAANAVQQSVGFSGYLHGIGYDAGKFQQELNSAVKYIKSQSKAPARAGSR